MIFNFALTIRKIITCCTSVSICCINLLAKKRSIFFTAVFSFWCLLFVKANKLGPLNLSPYLQGSRSELLPNNVFLDESVVTGLMDEFEQSDLGREINDFHNTFYTIRYIMNDNAFIKNI